MPSQIEYETKVLDIDVNLLKEKLRSLGAKEEPERLMRRWVYDINPDIREFIRLRDDGTQTTLTYKQRNEAIIGSTTELEVVVQDFEKTAEIFEKIPNRGSYYQENRRHTFVLENITYCFDSWPLIPTLLEIESIDKEGVEKGLKLLNLSSKSIGDEDIKHIYAFHGIDLHSFKYLTFDI